MADGPKGIVNVDLDEAATKAVDATSKGIAGFFYPWQRKRAARANAEALRIETEAEIEANEKKQIALHRMIEREMLFQSNMEGIGQRARLLLHDGADPEKLEPDWVTNFFEKSRTISDEQMQSFWARVLAGEVNHPGSFSRRTVNFIADLDKGDCDAFTRLCRFRWVINFDIGGDSFPIILDYHEDVYQDHGVDFAMLNHLASIGLIHFDPTGEWTRGDAFDLTATYFERVFDLRMPASAGTKLHIGHVDLTQVGQELSPISGATPLPAYLDYMLDKWSHLLTARDSPP